jgi:uncharacterized protein YndB with AHSA1/START domain
MMQSEVTIRRPVDEVFGLFVDLDKYALQVDPGAESVVKSPDGPTAPGTEFRFRQYNLGKMRETVTRYTAVEPNRRIEFEAEIGPMRPKCDLTFEPIEGGTRLMFSGDSNPVAPLRLLSPLLNRKGEQVWSERLRRVKEFLESR